MLKELIEQYETLEKITNKYDAQMAEDPENAEIEARWDKAYTKEYAAMAELVTYIIKLTGIDNGTARKMIILHRDELKEIAKKEVA